MFDMKNFSDSTIIIFGTFLLHQSVFWIYNGVILLLTYVIFPRQAKKYKIQKDVEVDAKSVRECAKTVLINQLFVLLPTLILICPIFMSFNIRWHLPFPTWYQIVFELISFIGVTEVSFYYSHAMLHWSRIYEHVHKQHHRFRAPIGLACEYAHPVEFLVSNMSSVLTGPLLFRSHLLTTWLWMVIALTGTINHHCGYKLPGMIGTGILNPSFHDFHHAKFTNNYGLLGILDRLHGTDKAWQESKRREKQEQQRKSA